MQIKRPDPHPPEHHDPSNPAPASTETTTEAESLVSEPACCPYCQQPEFGVTYEPPPFRRGLSYANANQGLGSFASAMSSSSSLNSTTSPTLSPHPHTHKRRTTSISANASTVITTDRVRPDWATKLANARSHLARRSAAATALHTAAYLIGNGAADSRGFAFSGRSRFGRSRGDNSPVASGAATPSPTTAEGGPRSVTEQLALMRREAQETGTRRRSRMEDLEEMMMMEAIRLSLAAEEERKKKADKEAAKEAKKKAKEDKKREKKEKKVYGSGASSASGSALSLSLPGLGRRRGNSGASNLAREITPEDMDSPASKGKGVDRSVTSAPSSSASGSVPIDFPRSRSSTGIPGARHLDTATLANIHDLHQPSPSPTVPDKPSHLRQMSNASSPSSSFIESVPGSLRNEFHGHGSSSTLDSPTASGTNIANHSGDTPDDVDTNGNALEPMFNFQSLAAMIGSEDNKEDREDAAKHIEYLSGGGESSRSNSAGGASHTGLQESVATLKVDNSNGIESTAHADSRQTTLLEPHRTTPEVTLTPETPAASTHDDHDGKQLGWTGTKQIAREITQ